MTGLKREFLSELRPPFLSTGFVTVPLLRIPLKFHDDVPTPEDKTMHVQFQPRQDVSIHATPVPTFTFGKRDQYIPLQATNPEPSGDKLQIYPTGIYDDFPKEGINVAFGPDLRKRIGDTMAANCKDKLQEQCRNALIPVVQNTDISTHVKRLVSVAAILLDWLIDAIIIETIIIFEEKASGALDEPPKPPKELHYSFEDLDRIHSMGLAGTIAIVTSADAKPTTIIVPAPSKQTPTATGEITMETLTADDGERKAGDIIYHIPDPLAQRMRDFLSIMGLDEARKECQAALNGNQKRADRALPRLCAQRARRVGLVFASNAPQDMIHLNPLNNPAPPGAGQVVGFPMPNIMLDAVPILIPVYRVVRVHVVNGGTVPPPQPPNQEVFDVGALARSSIALSIVMHVLMTIGEFSLNQIWVPQHELNKNLKDEDFRCPKDLVCIADDCKGQEEHKEITERSAICKQGGYEGCRCKKVGYPEHYEVPGQWMDQQYEWMEQLIKRANEPPIEAKCSQPKQDFTGAKVEFGNKHANLQDGLTSGAWIETESEAGLTWQYTWTNKQDSCPFGCKDIFSVFVEDDKCVEQDKLMKTGTVETQCGTAGYIAYKLGS
ncbi:uncharacterized protein BDR25DRAFT_372773 [Lindgomyces ingoldianus]|uniref:Uncharacterized protein n=1 Tax=Lindgomyces ingoldianus TaxID=673940 RepID=A0ACB6QPX1_9PLEO|nr:uncharacterized protein BDR25DRAFT_372773 [Lindgomyces ingoldianus]KAF2468917.1 hypothetical protein BDR25DRAFT_372773 [Lindgomyces ingoldianus]